MSNLKIKSVETIIVDLPMKRLQRFSATDAKQQSIVLVRIFTEDGIEGLGESCTPSGPWWGGESVESIKLMIDTYIAPVLIGADPFSLIGLAQSIERKVFGNAFAKAGVEMALLDIQGKAVNLPLYDLLGGAVRTSLSCSWPLATGDPDQEIEEAETMLDARRYNVFKMKMGALPPADDVRRACKVANALRDHASVRVDPNEEWNESTAKWAIPRLEDAGVSMIEQPIPRYNIDACARITARSNAAIMIDEGVCTEQDVIRIAKARAGDVVSLKIMKSGGIMTAKRIADIAIAGGVEVYMGTFLECSVGTAAGMQLAVTLPSLPYGGELSGPGLIADDIVQEAAIYKDFELQLTPGVGIGVQLDQDKLKHFRRDRKDALHQVKTVA